MPSYSPVFSAQFILYTDDAPNTSFEVPAGFTAVIRQVTVYTTAGGVTVQSFIQNEPGSPPITYYTKDLYGVLAFDSATVRVVVPGGGVITLILSDESTGAQVYVGGYLLRNTLT